MKRYVFRVMVQGEPGEWITVRHYQTLRAAQHCACSRSSRHEGKHRIERSEPIEFEYRDTVHVVRWYEAGVAL